MSEFLMPSLGSDMEAGTLIEWLKAPGEAVHRGDIVAVVETQKGAIEIEIFEDGVIEEQLVEIGQTVPVGMPLARLKGAGETAPPPEAAPPQVPEPAPLPIPAPPPQALPLPGAAGVLASPAARKLAAERGLDLDVLTGSGPGGAVVLSDLGAGSGPAPGTAPAKVRPRGVDLEEMRKAIAAAMSRSKQEIPHYYLSHDVDLAAAAAWLERTNAAREPIERLLMGALLLKAVALALTKHKAFNGFYGEEGFLANADIHIGTAVSIRGGGLVAPAIHNTDQLGLDEIMTRMRDLVARVRTGSLRSSELSAPTVTVSSLGERGVEGMFSIIYPPQVAILGIGKVVERPWPVAGEIALRPVVTVTLAGDHRVSDGHRGAVFLNEIDRLLQEPEAL
ncbi:2-oxo acid dehydrogenase subunit E2 [Pelagibius litoralis]|uniref:Dihydrolipoamide acetyltransferase component of pyruvate dehydrogenase complex n=1 Tax=Pelagibius litoralis TaxID=374515 RepID=A0A967EVE1_9PROT|nr:dihydrolipoamide acetyltransferase family protein [Pelagibius litoralis]NIA68541.1 2-oxo acid dehydrogenase subunit E2 [Pelagibius litoralis]